jgi:dipeptidyl aminopeptidase/acylaminoacyl peptidase
MIDHKFLRAAIFSFILFALILFAGPREAPAVQSGGVESRPVDIYSDGTRLSGDLFYPKGAKAGDNLPVIVLCHGWGGLRAHLNSSYAPAFAGAGYAVLSFDYRGWGDSDSRLIIKGSMPEPDANGEMQPRVRAVREIVDPRDQIEDIMNAVLFMSGEPMVDPERIGLWGTSLGGGHVVYVAAHDSRVKCIVSQVGALQSRWISRRKVDRQAIARTRSEMDQIPPAADSIKGLRGTPNLSRMADINPIDYADRLKIPVLIIDAEHENLFDRNEHGRRLYELLRGRVPVRYEILPGTHFEIYTRNRVEATKMAIDWFDKYLKK